MIFYSSVAIILGVLFIAQAIMFFRMNKYLNFAVTMIVSLALVVSGTLSFIFKNDLMFSIIFAILILIYILKDIVISKVEKK